MDTTIVLRPGRLRDLGFGAGDRWLQAASDYAGLLTFDTQSPRDGLPALEVRRAYEREGGDLPAVRAAIEANHWLDDDGHVAASAILDRIELYRRIPWTIDRAEMPES